jgi:hypothetical protein
MSEWWTYTLSDFLMFSPRTYFRTIELYNLAIWPAQLAGVAVGCGIFAVLVGWHGGHLRIVSALLAVTWLWIAWAFHWQRYAQINWAASWFAGAFSLQALLLAVAAVWLPSYNAFAGTRERSIAALVIAFVMLGYPLLAPLTGRPWTTAETFGVTADPTAIVTVAVAAVVRGRYRVVLLVIPVLWCLIAAATLWTMSAPEWGLLLASTVVALWPAIRRR